MERRTHGRGDRNRNGGRVKFERVKAGSQPIWCEARNDLLYLPWASLNHADISWLPSNKRRNKWPIKCWWRWRKSCAAWCRLISRNLRQTGNLEKSFYLHGLIRDSIEKIPSCGFGGIFVSFSISASLHSDLLLFSSETSSTLTSSWSERSSSFAMSSLSNFPVSSLFLRCLSFSRSVFRHFALLFWNQTCNYDVISISV